MLRVSILRSAHEFDSLRSRWQALAELSPNSTMFQSFEWNRLAAKVFGDREAPWVVHAVSDSGEAIVPSVLKAGEISLLGETLFDYRDVLSGGATEPLEAAFCRLAELKLPFRVTAIRGDAASLWPEASLRFFAGAPRVLRALCSAESFRRSHSRLASRARRLPRKGLTLHRYDNPPSALVRGLYEKKAKQADAGELFADQRRIEFMCNVAEASGSDCTIWCYEYESRDIAMLLALRHNRTRHFYTTWYDPEFGELSPGQALLFEAAAQTLSEDLDADFMTGEFLYKNRLANEVVPLFRVDARAEDVAQLASERGEHVRQPNAA